MSVVRFHKVTSLPGALEADALYFVQNGTFSETYITDDAGTALSLGNSAMIGAVATPLIAAAMADFNLVEIVATIGARDALDPARNLLVLVQDASADAGVDAGAALYAYSETGDSYIRIAEYESMDISLAWTNISGRPSSSVSLIDDAVTKRHAHTNKATLDKLGEAGGQLQFDGADVGGAGGSADWATVAW